MMPFAPAILLSAFLSISIGTLIYGRNPSHPINRILLAISGFLFYWGFTEFEYFQANDIHLALLWMRLSAFWYMVPPLVLQFSIMYANIRVRKPVLWISAFGPAIFFSFLEISGTSYQSAGVPLDLGKATSVNPKIFQYNYLGYVGLLWSVLISIAAMMIVSMRYRHARTPEEKNGYILAGFLIPIIVAISSNLLLPFLSMDVPDLTMPATAIGFSLVGYAVMRFGGYVLTASAAAEDILSTMGDPLFLVNSRGEIIVSNAAASRLLGYGKSELLGRTLNLLTQDSSAMDALLSHSPLGSYEADLRTKQGRAIPVSVSKSVIMTRRGSLVGHILICRDITDRKRMEAELGKAQRLAAVGETAAMVGHDLRNPLQAIMGAAYVLKTHESGLSEEGEEALHIIKDAIQRADNIISDLFEYSRQLRLELSTSDAKSLIDQSVASMKIPQNIRVVNYTNERPTFEVDVLKMKRVFLNLIKNAVDAMPNGGTLTIASTESDGNILVSISDTGEGIDEEILPRIWSPLFTTKAKGMGFGLAIARRFVEAHGGSVHVETKPGRGSTFTISLPIRQTAKTAVAVTRVTSGEGFEGSHSKRDV
jgi:PAS domain S-box-containing protein